MATISSHVLNATVGTHAGGTAVRLTGSDGAVLFEAMMDDGGRLQQEIAADQGRNSASVLDARSGGALSSSGYAVAQQLFSLVVELIRKPEVAGLARSSRA
ncbi:MAG TPA: hypothetical protein VMW31_06090, partial [Devosiaceae bacterium]|nr:hypothetical protein [Devosiaceae bacterium]